MNLCFLYCCIYRQKGNATLITHQNYVTQVNNPTTTKSLHPTFSIVNVPVHLIPQGWAAESLVTLKYKVLFAFAICATVALDVVGHVPGFDCNGGITFCDHHEYHRLLLMFTILITIGL